MRRIKAILALIGLIIPLGVVLQPLPAGAASGEVLILGPTVTGGAGSTLAQKFVLAGKTPVVVTAAQWSAMTTAQFASYDAVVLGDPTCSGLGPAAAAQANTAVWSPAVTGNVVIIGTDETYHESQGGAQLMEKAAAFTVAKAGKTGAYISLSCYYHGTAPMTPVPLLDGFGTFTARGVGCFNDAHIVASHPALAGLTDATLSNWSCSVHEGFDKWPVSFEVLAIARGIGTGFTAPDGSVGTPYILARGVEVISDIKLSPADATNPIRTPHTVTAKVTKDDPAPGTPVVGTTVTFSVVAGPHTGTTGTAVTDASGLATFTYTGTVAGTDTIEATFVDGAGRTQRSNRVLKTWVAKATPTISTAASASVAVGGAITDTATLTGGNSPSGSVTFRVFGPGDTTCSTSLATLSGTISGGVATSAPFNTTAVGTYRWVASYPGDGNNNAVSGACGDAGESVNVVKARPTISTTPSGSVPAGGTVSDTASVAGGFSPSGTVTFTLYGPGDTTCARALATRTGTLSGGSASSGGVGVGAAGTYNWTAVYGGDTNNDPAKSPCGSEPVVVTPQRLTGRAYGLTAKASAVSGAVIVDVAPIPDTGKVSTTSSSTTPTPCLAALSGLVSAHLLCANVTTVDYPGKSTASASTADATVAIPSIATITMRVVKSTSTTTCAGSAGTTTIDYLAVGGVVVVNQTTTFGPNSRIDVGPVHLVLNEQVPFSTPDKGLTVNAVHATVNTAGLARVDVIVASSESDIGNCP